MATPIYLQPPPPQRPIVKAQLRQITASRQDLAARLRSVRDMGMRVRACEVHLTANCNIRCKGCWYFEGGFDQAVVETRDIRQIEEFATRLADDGYTQATLIGGEPTLVLDRIKPFVERLPYVTISTNGLRPLPRLGFENVAVGVSIFGGGPLDDDLRAYRVNGASFTGLFGTALKHYREDPRVTFVFALSEAGLPFIEPTIRAIQDNGNLATFNYYSEHGTDDPLRITNEQRTLDEATRVQAKYPETVVCPPYFIETLITGRTHWGGAFGYDVCPSISVDHPDHVRRVENGFPTLDGFAVFGADFKTLQFCCTSGDCGACRDSQAVYSWLMVNMHRFVEDETQLELWIELAESYWRQWYWAQGCSPNFARRAGSLSHPA